jgi:putative pyruvate formate lyase activating enzyme
VNLMDQYYPAGKVSAAQYPELNRRLSSREFDEARAVARELGLRKLDERRPHRGWRNGSSDDVEQRCHPERSEGSCPGIAGTPAGSLPFARPRSG